MRIRLFLIVWAMACPAAWCETLTVGAGMRFATIEAANAAANAGDTIEVYPAAGDGIYHRPALYVTKPGLRFVAKAHGGGRITLDGAGFEYSGVGSTPRAIFQVNRGADDVLIEGFELRNARNTSHNGAGVRINQARRTAVRKCDIHHNQMGVMSNGTNGDPTAADEQLFEFCLVHENGDPQDPGFNHNFYLGGTSATIQFCDVYGSLTGHNIKSRAHFNLMQYNYVHDSANREFDLVDAWDTTRPDSNAVLIANFIVKRNPIDGNTNVIQFGQDGGGEHDGTLFLINNTIVTPHFGPVIQLTAAQARAQLVNNIIFNDRQNGPRLYQLVNVSDPHVITGDHNWLSRGYDASATAMDPATTYRGRSVGDQPGFVDRAGRDFRLRRQNVQDWPPNAVPIYLDGGGVSNRAIPAYQYRPTAARIPRGGPSARYIGGGDDSLPICVDKARPQP